MNDERQKSPVDVPCAMRFVRAKQIAVFDGRTCDGEEHWIWLPRSMVTWRHLESREWGRVVVTMPKWLAEDRGMHCLEITS